MIPMRDGIELAANLLLPDTGEAVPAVLQFFPYQKDGRVGHIHEPFQRYFAERGYASLLVDFRGTGNSGGHNPGPLAPEERQDGHDVVEWLAGQPWCSGKVGVWGISYGGITALSIASTRPRHLGAIVPIHATTDNYAWLFRPDGCQGLLLPDLGWGSQMTGITLVPPPRSHDPAAAREKWLERLEHAEPWVLPWHGVPPDHEYWTRRIIDVERIEAPTFGIAAWHDAYVQPMLDVHAALRVPKRMLIGPWKHSLPDTAPDHPIGGAHEMTRWWDRWLKGITNGVEEEPPFTIFVMGDDIWRSEAEWPPARSSLRDLFVTSGARLVSDDPVSSGVEPYDYDARVGAASIGTNNQPVSLPVPDDQSIDDHLSLAWTATPLEVDTEICGRPTVVLSISATVPAPQLTAKLCIVRPSGASRTIGRGWLNVAQPDPHRPTEPLAMDEIREVRITMRPTSFVARKGDRVRLCVAGADFPQLWPTGLPHTLNVHHGPGHAGRLELPIVPAGWVDPRPPRLEPAARGLTARGMIRGSESFEVRRSLSSREIRYVSGIANEVRVDPMTTLATEHRAVASTDADAPDRSQLETDTRFTLSGPTGVIDTHVVSVVSLAMASVTVTVRDDGREVLHRQWQKQSGTSG